MRKQSSKQPIENAAEVIERFGGIRPMAKKIDVAVTTIQGWKKRDVIPAARLESILDAAQEHEIDLSDIVPGSGPVAASISIPETASASEAKTGAANQNDRTEIEDKPARRTVEKEETPQTSSQLQPAPQPKSEPVEISGDLEEKLAAVEKKVVSSNTWMMLALVALVLAALAALFWPQRTSVNGAYDRLSALEARTQEIEGEMAGAKDQQSFFGTLIPEDLDKQLAHVQEQAGQAMEKARAVSGDVLGEDAGTLEERAAKLETHLQDMTGSPVLAGVLEKWQSMSSEPMGTAKLDEAMAQLSALMNSLDTDLGADLAVPDDAQESVFETTLDAARGENEALGQAFAGVPTSDLKAAALLLTMSQFRSSLNRNNEAFEGDLDVLMGLVGEDNMELRSSLERLAPYSQSGVLTPGGLTDEFKTLAGDAVVASLKGEDVSMQERAKARMNELFEVEKDGEMISGTDTQIKIAKAENLLQDGDVEGAIATVETLDPDALQAMGGWLDKAQVTLMAQKLKRMIGDNIEAKAYGSTGVRAPTYTVKNAEPIFDAAP